MNTIWLEHDVLYHGTTGEFAELIDRYGFCASLAGAGQTELYGVFMTPCYSEAERYATSTAKHHRETPVILLVKVPSGTWADFRGLDWRDFVDCDPRNTDLLRDAGYDGAIIPSTVRRGGPEEYVWFDPNRLRAIELDVISNRGY